MAIFNDNIKENLTKILSQMKENVNIIYFTQEIECNTCGDTRKFLEEISQLNDKIKLTIFNFQLNQDKAKELVVMKIPAIILLDKDNNDTGVRFYGLPGGYEINSFLSAILEISGNKTELPENILNRIKAINKDIHIQVFVTLVCPYCPASVVNAHKLALENKKIKADMIESSTFPHLAIKYSVQGVPKTIINEKHELVGAHPIENLLDLIEKI